MLSRNNYKERLRKMEPKKDRFSIRKFTIGAASVLIGSVFFAVSGNQVQADVNGQGTGNGTESQARAAEQNNQGSVDEQSHMNVQSDQGAPAGKKVSTPKAAPVEKSGVQEHGSEQTSLFEQNDQAAENTGKKVRASEQPVQKNVVSSRVKAIANKYNDLEAQFKSGKLSQADFVAAIQDLMSKLTPAERAELATINLAAEEGQIVTVNNFQEFSKAFMNKDVSTIKLGQDLDFSDLGETAAGEVPGGLRWNTKGEFAAGSGKLIAGNRNGDGIARTLTIDGQGQYKLNMGNRYISLWNNNYDHGGQDWNITLKDITIDTDSTDRAMGIFHLNTNSNHASHSKITFDGVTANVKNTALVENNGNGGVYGLVTFAGKNTINNTLPGANYSSIVAQNVNFEDKAVLNMNVTNPTVKNNSKGNMLGNNAFYIGTSNQRTATLQNASDNGNFTVGEGAQINFNANTVVLDKDGNITTDNRKTSGIHNMRFMYNVNAQGGNVVLKSGSDVKLYMGDGHSTAIHAGNLEVDPSANLYINTLQDNNKNYTKLAPVGSGASQTHDGWHWAPITLDGVDTQIGDINVNKPRTKEALINGTVKIVRGIPGQNIQTVSPLISLGSSSTNESATFNFTVGNGATLDLQDNSNSSYDTGSMFSKGMQWIGSKGDVNFIGLISIWGTGSTDTVLFDNPQYINLQRTGSQIGNTLRVEGLKNNIIVRNSETQGTPLAQWMGQNRTATPDEAWRISELDAQSAGGDNYSNFLPSGAKAGDKGGEYFDNSGFLKKKYMGAPFAGSNGTAKMAKFLGDYSFINGTYNGLSMDGVHGIGLTSLTNDFSWWSPRRITIGENKSVVLPDSVNYEPEAQAINKTTKDKASDFNTTDLQNGIKDLLGSDATVAQTHDQILGNDSLIDWTKSSWGIDWERAGFSKNTDPSTLSKAKQNIYNQLKKLDDIMPEANADGTLKVKTSTADDFNGRVATIVYKDDGSKKLEGKHSVDFVLIPVNVTQAGEADDHNPTYAEVSAKVSDNTPDPITWNNLHGASNPTNLKGVDTTVTWVTPKKDKNGNLTGDLVVSPTTDVKPGVYTIPVTITYSDGTTDKTPATIVVTGDQNGESHHVYYGEQSTVDFSGDARTAHKTTDDNYLTAQDHHFDTITYQDGYNQTTKQYEGAKVVYTWNDANNDYETADGSKKLKASDITYTWQSNNQGVEVPNTNWTTIKSTGNDATTTTTDKNSEQEKTQTGQSLVGNSRYRMNFSLSSDAATALGLPKNYNSWANAFYDFKGASANENANVAVTGQSGLNDFTQDQFKSLINHTDLDNLPADQKVADNGYSWANQPVIENGALKKDANGNVGTVRITFVNNETDANGNTTQVPTYLDIDIPATAINFTPGTTDADKYNPSYEGITGKPGETKEKDVHYTGDTPTDATYSITNSPITASVDNDGKVKVTIPADAKPGTVYNIPVTVTYTRDNSTDNVYVPVIVTDKDGNTQVIWGKNGALVVTTDPNAYVAHETSGKSQLFDPKAGLKVVEQHKQNSNGKLDETGVVVNNSEITADWATNEAPNTVVTDPEKPTKEGKAINGKITVTLPANVATEMGLDNRTQTVLVNKIQAKGAQAKDNSTSPVTVKEGTHLTADEYNKLVDRGFADNTVKGYDWQKAPTSADKNAVIRITFNDKNGTQNTYLDVEIPADNLTVIPAKSDADKYNPDGGTIIRMKGSTLGDSDAEAAITNVYDPKPNADNSKNLPEGTRFTWKNAPDTSTIGDKTGVVTVNYPDHSSEDVDVMVHVIDDAEKYDPQTTTVTVKKNDPVPDAKSAITNVYDPSKPNDEHNLPDGTEYTWTIAPDTKTPGTQPVIVHVSYPDGSSEDVPTTVVVTDENGNVPTPDPSKDNTKYTPEPSVITVNKGETPDPNKGISNLTDLPSGTKVTWKTTTPDTNTPGDKPTVVTVTYPDGSSEDVPTIVHVNPDDADTHTPEGQNIVVNIGQSPEPEAGIINKDTLPSGTTYVWDTPIDTSTVGDKPGIIVVAYPDGSQDKVPVIVTVKDPNAPKNTDADKNDPIGGTITAKVNDDLSNSAKSGIVNAGQLPEGTTFTWTGETPKTDKDHTGLSLHYVTVTYPDHTSEDVPVYVRVVGDSDSYTPIPKVITVKPGEKPDPNKGISNLPDLPSGTKVTWKKEPDTKTPGDKPGTLIVTYPDGTTDEVPTIVHVTEPDNGGGDVTPNPDPVVSITVNYRDPEGNIIKTVTITQPVGGDPSQSIKDQVPGGYKITDESQVPHVITEDGEIVTIDVEPINNGDNNNGGDDNGNGGNTNNGGNHGNGNGNHGNGINSNSGIHGLGNGSNNGAKGQGLYGNGNDNGKNNKALPQTGEEQNNAGIFGLALAAIAGFFGIAADRKRKN